PLNDVNGGARVVEYSAEVSRGDPKATAEYNFWNERCFRCCRAAPGSIMKRPSTWSLLVFDVARGMGSGGGNVARRRWSGPTKNGIGRREAAPETQKCLR